MRHRRPTEAGRRCRSGAGRVGRGLGAGEGFQLGPGVGEHGPVGHPEYEEAGRRHPVIVEHMFERFNPVRRIGGELRGSRAMEETRP